MKVTTHGEHLTKLMRLRAVNAYLVREDDGLTLVDTMIGGSAKGIVAAADGLGAPIVRILLTHAHGDHVGSVDALVAALPDAELLISRRDARFLAGDRSLDPDEPTTKLSGGYPRIDARPTRLLEPGDRIGSLEAHASPGHTPGHLAFLDTRDRTLIAGDAYSSLGGVAVTDRINPRFPLVGMATWDGPTTARSARELRTLEPARLATGHGPVVTSPLPRMDQALARSRG
jgi:glyoxylase-like metal-dependent hydrolase (beta-lactamase superfamily II)